MTISNVQKKRLRYIWVAAFLLLAIATIGGLLNRWMTSPLTTSLQLEPVQSSQSDQLAQMFSKAVVHMQSGDYEQALNLWHAVLLINPEIPEVKVNMGFSLFETGQYEPARDFFISAIDQNPFQSNAYYGLAICNEQLGDLEAAVGAMKSYIHLAQAQDESFIRKASSALWEWESKLKSESTE